MTQSSNDLPPVGTILSGSHWPGRVRVVRVEPRGTSRVLIEAVTLDGQARLISRLLKREDLAGLQVEAESDRSTLDGDPAGFRLAAEAARIRLAYTFDPQFAVSVARIDPLPHQLEAVYHTMLRQPRLRFLLADDPSAGKTIMAGLLLKELKLRGAVTRTLTEWGLSVTAIDGTMAPAERYRSEQVFRDPEGAQVMLATEAAGEGINLQFCHLMINYDLPWNPSRLEQRMGRVHRYGQKYEVYIYNLAATSTREGMVLHALLNKLERMREGLGQDRVFDVVDQLLQGVSLEALIRDALANRLTFEEVRDRVLARLDVDQERRLKEVALAGLATRYVDLTRLRADRQRAAEARLVPAYIRAFFTRAMEALSPGRLERRDDGYYRLPYVPAALREVPDELRRRCGLPGESYSAITFDKSDLREYPTLTFVGPGHPLFEAVLHHVLARFGPDLARGAVLHDPGGRAEGLFWLLRGGVEDGLGRVVGQRLFAIFQPLVRDLTAKPQRTPGENKMVENFAASAPSWYNFLPVSPARLLDFDPPGAPVSLSEAYGLRLAEAEEVIDWSLERVLDPYLAELQARRREETEIIRDYLGRSFDVLIARAQSKLMEYEGKTSQGVDMSLRIQEERRHLDDLRRRQAGRLAETERAAVLSLGAPQVVGVAAIVSDKTFEVLETSKVSGIEMRRSDEVEAAAMAHAIDHERARGWEVEDVSVEARGYDLLSRGPHGAIRYIEVKGRAGEGAVELSANEWLKAEQLGGDYWLYIVTDALTSPSVHLVQDPAHRLPREEVVPQVRYRVAQEGWHRGAESATEYTVELQRRAGGSALGS